MSDVPHSEIKCIVDIRYAVGDNGMRVQNELVECIKEIVRDRAFSKAALNVALESLDQIGAMTKKGRASVHARSTAIFIRTQLEAAQRKEGV